MPTTATLPLLSLDSLGNVTQVGTILLVPCCPRRARHVKPLSQLRTFHKRELFQCFKRTLPRVFWLQRIWHCFHEKTCWLVGIVLVCMHKILFVKMPATATLSLLYLDSLGNVTQVGTIILVPCCPRWARHVKPLSQLQAFHKRECNALREH